MLTLQMLKDMKPGTIFATGITIDNSSGINMSNSGKLLRWVAKRGYAYDWAIYIHFEDKSIDFIKDYGDKVTSKENIKRLVECNDESFNAYRY